MKKSKVLLLMLCTAALSMAAAFGTLAYLMDTEAVTNTFTVGQVQITLDEADVDGSKTNVTTEGRDKANAYKLMPGHKYDKDPKITVADGSEDCYLFVTVVDEIAAIEDADTVATQMAAKGWAAVPGYANTYIYTQNGKKAAVSAKGEVTVFETFAIKGDVDNNTLATYANKTITVTAYAVQAAGFEGEDQTPEAIWATTFGAPAAG